MIILITSSFAQEEKIKKIASPSKHAFTSKSDNVIGSVTSFLTIVTVILVPIIPLKFVLKFPFGDRTAIY